LFAVPASEVGDVAQFQLLEATHFRLGHLRGQRDLQLAEIAAEDNLLIVGQRLVGKGQDSVLIHATFKRRYFVGGDRPADIDASHLTDEARLHGSDVDCHDAGSSLSGD